MVRALQGVERAPDAVRLTGPRDSSPDNAYVGCRSRLCRARTGASPFVSGRCPTRQRGQRVEDADSLGSDGPDVRAGDVASEQRVALEAVSVKEHRIEPRSAARMRPVVRHRPPLSLVGAVYGGSPPAPTDDGFAFPPAPVVTSVYQYAPGSAPRAALLSPVCAPRWKTRYWSVTS